MEVKAAFYTSLKVNRGIHLSIPGITPSAFMPPVFPRWSSWAKAAVQKTLDIKWRAGGALCLPGKMTLNR